MVNMLLYNRHFVMDLALMWLFLCLLLVCVLPGSVEGKKQKVKEVEATCGHYSSKAQDSKRNKQSQPLETTSKDGNSSMVIGLSEMVTGFQPRHEQNIADKCIKTPPCDEKAKYRSITGDCNNLKFTMWGVANSAFVRLMPAHYQDGVNKIRKSKSGKELPNARQLRTMLFRDKNVPDQLNMLNVMSWGQLVAHDTAQAHPNSSEDCCTAKASGSPESCLPIYIPKNDQFYSKYKQTCLNMVRSETTEEIGCRLSPHQQTSSVTHFLDASFIYGSNKTLAKDLRTLSDGKLKVQKTSDKREFPPNTRNPKEDCNNQEIKDICYLTGDIRANQNPDVTVLQVILFREHNRLCTELKKMNPLWDDEKLYQEARRILIAIVQRITYNDYLPKILGKEFLEKSKLVDGQKNEPLSNLYDSKENPSTVNEFTTAAFRAFHSMIPHELILYDKDLKSEKVLRLDNFYFQPSIVQEPGMLDKFLRGLAFQHSESQDKYFSDVVTNNLFKFSKPYGTDLEAISIQRGRDHGLPTYNEFRSACGLTTATSFDDLKDLMSQEVISLFKSTYEDVNDVDLYVGGVLEEKASGALVGPTFQCIIGEQFKRWRNGDRFFYDFGNQSGSFSQDQVNEIRKVSLSGLFCENGDSIDKIQRDAFEKPSKRNPIVSCKSIMKLNLTAWKE